MANLAETQIIFQKIESEIVWLEDTYRIAPIGLQPGIQDWIDRRKKVLELLVQTDIKIPDEAKEFLIGGS